MRSIFFACVVAALGLSGCYTSHLDSDGGPLPRDGSTADGAFGDGGAGDATLRDGGRRDGGFRDAMPPPPPPPDLIREGCVLICDVSLRCFGEPDPGSCADECFMAAAALPGDVCAELWYELGLCVSSAPCDVVVGEGLEEFCGSVVERLQVECGLEIGEGDEGGGGSAGSGGAGEG